MSEPSEYVAELQRHINVSESRVECSARLHSIEAELVDLRSDFQDMSSTLSLILAALTKQPN